MFSITYWVSAFGDHYLVPRKFRTPESRETCAWALWGMARDADATTRWMSGLPPVIEDERPRGPSLFAMGGNLPRWQFKNGSTAPIELGAEVVPFYHAWDRSLGCHVFYAR